MGWLGRVYRLYWLKGLKKYLEKAILHIAAIKPVRFMGKTCQTVNLARTASFEPLIVQK